MSDSYDDTKYTDRRCSWETPALMSNADYVGVGGVSSLSIEE